jgi:uncharacterized protein
MADRMWIADAMGKPAPDAVHLKGLIGQRFENSRRNRLIHQEEDHLLWPFQEHCPVGWYPEHLPRPGLRGDWHGEFLGTWIDAAVLSAWNAADTVLRQKIDLMIADWLATQAPDGYLGTYDEADRWKSWDIWIQAHDMIGLLSYYRFTGKIEILQAAVRIADRVLLDFGPGKRSLRETGPHMGMASSAFLEPLIWLYRETGEERYLTFGRWLVESDWEGEGGPQILSALLGGLGVAGTANSKGIEMLIDFAGLLELCRVTGEARYLQTILTAWEDIVSHHLYITGSASTGEYFTKDFGLLNEGIYMIGETCVSMGWLYLNLSLGRLTGDARFFDMAEQTLYNHLMAAQSEDGRQWIYYLGLRDSKRFCWHTDPECCPSRGVRAIAQLPTHAFNLLQDGIAINFYDAAEACLPLPSGQQVQISLETAYPLDGQAVLRMDLDSPETFALHLRMPGWCRDFSLKLNGQGLDVRPDTLGYLALRREWSSGDEVELVMEMPVRVTADRLGNAGRCAVTRGPLVFAADVAYLPQGVLLDDVILALVGQDPGKWLRVITTEKGDTVHLVVPRAALQVRVGAGFWREDERYHDLAGIPITQTGGEIELVPFFEAGNRSAFEHPEGIQPNTEAVRGIHFQVWLPYLLA